MKRKILKILRIKLVSLAFLVLFLVSLYVLALRIASLFLEDYRTDFERYLTSVSGQEVQIKSLGSTWRGLDPTLNIHGLSINGSGEAYFGRIRVQLSFIDSLLNLKPALKEILVEHTEISLQQSDDGAWSIASIPINVRNLLEQDSSPVVKSSDFQVEKLLSQARINLKDLSLSLHNNRGLVQALRIPETSVTYHDDSVYISGSIRESDGASALLSFSLEGKGVLSEAPLETDLYVEARSAEFFGKLLQVYSWEKVSIDDLSASTRAWFSFEGAELKSVQGELQLIEMNWRAGLRSAPPIRNLAFNYRWLKKTNGGELAVSGLNYSWLGRVCQTEGLRVELYPGQIEVSVSELDLFCTSQLGVASGLLPNDLHDRLEISRPEGQLKNLWIEISEEDGDKNFTLSGELEQVGLEAYDGTPSGMGIDGYVYADPAHGFVSFESDNFELGFPDLFLEPWTMERTEGFVAWDIEGEDVVIYSDGLRLWQQDGGLVYGDFSLLLNDDDHEDYLDLSIGMQNLSARSAPSFVPYHIVGSDLHRWLVDSLQDGSVSSGVYLGLGSVETEEADNSFTSSIDLNSKQLVLKFDPEWPPAEQLNANISLQNSELLVEVPAAVIAGSQVKQIKATMFDPEGDASSILRIESATSANADNLQYWLAESPISEHTQAISEQLVFKGVFDVEVLLDIPVSEGNDDAELAYLIRSYLKDITVSHPDSGIDFSSVNGVLDVSSDQGVTAEDISVIAFGNPATLNITTSFDNTTYDHLMTGHESDEFADLSQTNLSLEGRTDIAQIFRFFGYETTAYMEGELPYQASLYLPNHSEADPSVEIRSNLKGLARNWPAPFNKAVDIEEDFLTRLKITPSELRVLSSLEVNEVLTVASELLFVNGDFSFGVVSLNDAYMERPALDGLNIAGSLETLNVDPWIGFIGELTKLPWGDAEEKGEGSILKKVQLDLNNAIAFGYRFSETRAEIAQGLYSWDIDLKGNDLDGAIILPGDDSPIGANFSRLSLYSAASEFEQADSTESDEIDPRELPDLAFAAESLSLDGRSIGSWRGNLDSSNEGAIVSGIEGRIKEAAFSGRLNWQVLDDSLHNSILTLKGNGKHFEDVFRLLGFDPLVSSDDFSSTVAVTWIGAPMDFELGRLSGTLGLRLQDGFMQTDDQKTGALRLFGVLNAESIIRRLKLDFSDLYKSGVGFDSLSLGAGIDQGLLTLKQPLIVDGPAGKYTVNGVSDLAAKSLDFDMLVELPFSQNVPLAALVLGAPQIGGLVWLADKLLGEPLSALTTARYDITGTWDKPIMELKEVVNARKKDRKDDRSPRRVTPEPAKKKSKKETKEQSQTTKGDAAGIQKSQLATDSPLHAEGTNTEKVLNENESEVDGLSETFEDSSSLNSQ